MSENEKKQDYSGYSLAFAFMALAGIIYILPDEYLFSWSRGVTTVILMISSVFFAYSVEEMLGNKKIFDNIAVAMAIFYIIYGIVLLLKNFSLLNEWSVLVLLIVSVIPLYGIFVGIFSLGNFIRGNIKTKKGKTLELILKLIPVFLPVVNLILKVLKII